MLRLFMRPFVASLLVCAGTPTAIADDKNPLNLPPPIQDGSLGTVMLHGGGPLSDEIFEKFIKLAGGNRARIVLIPSGSYVQGRDETTAQFEARFKRDFTAWDRLMSQGRVADFQFLYTDIQADANDGKFVARLKDTTGVWIPAAYQGKLDWRFAPDYPEKTSLFQEALRRVLARGGVVGGLGGGMAALPEVMIMGETRAENGLPQAFIRSGLALFNGAIVDQNFDARVGRLERFTGLLKDTARLNQSISWPAAGRNMIGLAVERATALLVRGNTISAIGNRQGHIFLKGNGDRTINWRILSPSDGKVKLVAPSAQSVTAKSPASQQPPPDRSSKNPFGMPSPAAGKSPGMVVLHGGGGTSAMIEVYPRLAGHQRPSLVVCPAASSRFRPQRGATPESLIPTLRRRYYEWEDLRNEGRLADLKFLTTSNRADANKDSFVAPLRAASGVWFSGGDQNALAHLFVDANASTLFQRELWEVVRRGGVVGGTSAGAAAMAQVMTASGESANDQPAEPVPGHGFGVLNNVVIEQHFQGSGRAGRIERFTRLLRDNDRLRKFLGNGNARPEGMLGLAIEERTALLLQENRLKVFGDNHAHVFLKSADQKTITWHELQSGDAAFIYEGDSGPVLELDDWRVR